MDIFWIEDLHYTEDDVINQTAARDNVYEKKKSLII